MNVLTERRRKSPVETTGKEVKGKMSNKHIQSKQSASSPAGYDPVAALQQVARAMPAAVNMTKAQIADMRSAQRRAPSKLIALVLSEAEEGGGSVAGVPIDATASRSDVAQATNLRVGAAAARAIARRLEQQALVLASGVAQRALSATTSLQALARTPEGSSYVAKAAELRTAARGAKKRKAKETTATGTTPAAAAAEAVAPAAETTPVVTGPAPAAHGVTAAAN
jgi:hypothetical protein